MRLLLLERYQQAQDAGEVAGEGRPKTVSAGNSLPDTADLGLSRKKLSETRKVARAGGMSFATRNDLLGLMWAPMLRTLEEWQGAVARGEAAGHGRSADESKVRSPDLTLATTDDLGLDRRRLSEIRKVARAGGWPFADW